MIPFVWFQPIPEFSTEGVKELTAQQVVVQPESMRKLAGLPAIFPGRK